MIHNTQEALMDENTPLEILKVMKDFKKEIDKIITTSEGKESLTNKNRMNIAFRESEH
jgi:hypothetical protein